MTNDVLLEKRPDGVALVTLNRPQAMNALSIGLRAALLRAMLEIRDDPEIRAVVLTGAGERAFTAGLDLKELSEDTANLSAATDQDPVSNPVRAVERCGKPVVGAINGVAITGGFELALACTMRIASTAARFADTHALVGLLPGWGLSQRLSRIIGLARAKELAFTGRFIDAQTACDWGIVNRVVAAGALQEEALALASRIASLDAGLLRDYGRLIDAGYELPFTAALAHETAFSTARNAVMTAAAVAQRRSGILERGRGQV